MRLRQNPLRNENNSEGRGWYRYTVISVCGVFSQEQDRYGHKTRMAARTPFFGALSGKEQINPAIFIRFFSSFFLGFLTFFSDSEPSGTIFHYLNAVRTVGFFKKLSYPLCEYGSKKNYRKPPDW